MSPVTGVPKHPSDCSNSIDNDKALVLSSLSVDDSMNLAISTLSSGVSKLIELDKSKNCSGSTVSPSTKDDKHLSLYAASNHKKYSSIHITQNETLENMRSTDGCETLNFFLNISAVTMVTSVALIVISALLTSVSTDWVKNLGESISLAAISLMGIGTSFMIISTLASVTPLFNKIFTYLDPITSRFFSR
ncbi:putative membrane protein [Candidatus Ichthyocystis hellenicum]|uniref:Putative membrane protein n=1 Tax=Candidatus Ichthyocystis hellenicum TaxID=1561003 RepID=A0A0S4M4B8_9BURK|nr:putative membrane protein [Candidatus Ichthyocystis hellenicum]